MSERDLFERGTELGVGRRVPSGAGRIHNVFAEGAERDVGA